MHVYSNDISVSVYLPEHSYTFLLIKYVMLFRVFCYSPGSAVTE